jgi:hypothetical protein
MLHLYIQCLSFFSTSFHLWETKMVFSSLSYILDYWSLFSGRGFIFAPASRDPLRRISKGNRGACSSRLKGQRRGAYYLPWQVGKVWIAGRICRCLYSLHGKLITSTSFFSCVLFSFFVYLLFPFYSFFPYNLSFFFFLFCIFFSSFLCFSPFFIFFP